MEARGALPYQQRPAVRLRNEAFMRYGGQMGQKLNYFNCLGFLRIVIFILQLVVLCTLAEIATRRALHAARI
jgi:hypothetical protein